MAPRRPVGRKRQLIGLAVLGVVGAGSIYGAFLVTTLTGAELGEPCVQGTLTCKAHDFNDARCLMIGDEGVCTRLCDDDKPCPTGYTCGLGEWVRRGESEPNGRVEHLCLRERPSPARPPPQPTRFDVSGGERSAPRSDPGAGAR